MARPFLNSCGWCFIFYGQDLAGNATLLHTLTHTKRLISGVRTDIVINNHRLMIFTTRSRITVCQTGKRGAVRPTGQSRYKPVCRFKIECLHIRSKGRFMGG